MSNTTTTNWVELLIKIIPVIPILSALGVFLTAKGRMKKKILNKLGKLANKDRILFPETRLRDLIYWDHLIKKPLSKKRFFNLFIESIRELISSEEIIGIKRGELFCSYPHPMYKNNIDPFPPCKSRISKTPSDYFLKEDDPDMYIGLKTTECEEYIKIYKARAYYKAEQISKHY